MRAVTRGAAALAPGGGTGGVVDATCEDSTGGMASVAAGASPGDG
ncbi:MAG: hypothetical protein WAU39_14695 [Polyangiales bacterium]